MILSMRVLMKVELYAKCITHENYLGVIVMKQRNLAAHVIELESQMCKFYGATTDKCHYEVFAK